MASADFGSEGGGSGRRSMQFELNLVPFIDMLSTMICFLLMTTVWIHLGVFNVSQAVGEQGQSTGEPPQTMIVEFKAGNKITFSLKDVPKASGVQAEIETLNWNQVEQMIVKMAATSSEIKTALVMPEANTKYEDVIHVMDIFKKHQIPNVGITPLTGAVMN